jgi:uncharacterized protein YjbI with pentapeptide repeats
VDRSQRAQVKLGWCRPAGKGVRRLAPVRSPLVLASLLFCAAVLAMGVQAPGAAARTIEGCEIKPRTVCFSARLRAVKIENEDMHDSVLSHALLFSTYLNGTNLSGSFLYEAELHQAHLDDTNLSHTNLINADFREANGDRVNLWGADLRGAYFEDTNLFYYDLRDADLRDAIINGIFYRSDLEGADLRGAHLVDALDEAILCHTTMPDGSVDNSGCKAAPQHELGRR